MCLLERNAPAIALFILKSYLSYKLQGYNSRQTHNSLGYLMEGRKARDEIG